MSNSPLRILSIFYGNPDYYPPIINSTYILDKTGYKNKLICRKWLNNWDIKYPSSLEIERIETPTQNSLLEYLSFLRKVLARDNSQIDIFIGHDAHGFLVARLLATQHHRPVLYHCHDFVEDERKIGVGGSLVKSFERRFARASDIVIVPDRERAEVIVDQLRLRHFPLIVANAPLFVPKTSDNLLVSTLRECGYSFDRIMLRQGTIGRGHCLEVTIRSIPFWKSHRWGFVILGPSDDAYKTSLVKLSYELGVQDQVVLLPPVRYDDVMKYTIDANLGHALYEPLQINHKYFVTASNKIMEYMAAGIPVLLSDTESSRSFLERYDVGIIADINSPQSIANAVNQIFDQPDQLSRLGQNGKRAFENDFRYDRQYAKVLEYLHGIKNHPIIK